MVIFSDQMNEVRFYSGTISCGVRCFHLTLAMHLLSSVRWKHLTAQQQDCKSGTAVNSDPPGPAMPNNGPKRFAKL